MHQIGVFKRDLTYVYFWKCHLSKSTKQDIWAARLPIWTGMGFTCHQVFRTKSGPLQVFKVYIAHTGLEHLVTFFGEGNCLSSIDPWPEKKSETSEITGGSTFHWPGFCAWLTSDTTTSGFRKLAKTGRLSITILSFVGWIHVERNPLSTRKVLPPKGTKTLPTFLWLQPPQTKKTNTHTHATLRSAHACVSFGRS